MVWSKYAVFNYIIIYMITARHSKLLPTTAQTKKHTVNFANFYFFMFRTFSAPI